MHILVCQFDTSVGGTIIPSYYNAISMYVVVNSSLIRKLKLLKDTSILFNNYLLV